MTQLTDGPDRLVYAVDTTGSFSLVVDEDTDSDGSYENSATITLVEDLMWGHADDSVSITIRGLYDEIESDLNLASGLDNSYVIEGYTPSGGSLAASGIRIRSDGTNDHPFRIDLTRSDSLDPNWLGWDSDGPHASASSGGREVVESPYTPRTFTLITAYTPSDAATEKPFDDEADLSVSHADPVTNFQVQNGPARESRKLVYEWVPAAQVRAGKASDSQHASNAGVPTGDIGSAIYWLHQSARQKRAFLVVHTEGDQDLQIDSHDWEKAILDKRQRATFSELIDQKVQDAPEHYNLTVEYTRTGDGNLEVR